MKSLAAVQREVIATWSATMESARDLGFNKRVKLPANPRILGSSVKVEKGEKKGVLTAVSYLSPALESGIDTCPYRAGCGCEKSCIGGHTGMTVFDSARNARLYKTALFFGNPSLFSKLLTAEVAALRAKASKLGLSPAVRINGSSDLPVPQDVLATFPDVVFYDYTKSFERALQSKAVPAAPHITLSFTGANASDCLEYLKRGGNVAVVFPDKGVLPPEWHGHRVIDGDESDVRFYDPPGTVVGLYFKRASKRAKMLEAGQSTGFVQLRSKPHD